MSEIRKSIQAGLVPLLPKRWKVLPYADELDPPLNPVVMVAQDRVARAAQQGVRTNGYSVYVVIPQTDPSRVEDVLDDALADLLDAIEGLDIPGLAWTEALRKVVAGLPAYEISLSITYRYAKD